MASSRIVQLARQILKHTEDFDEYLQSNGLPTPSFEPDAIQYSGLAQSAIASRQVVINLTDELTDLMLGPSGPLLFPDHTIFISAHAICHYGIAKKFPKEKDEVSYSELAAICGLSESLVRRILRHAMTRRIFQERANGMVAHTATSKLLAECDLAHDWTILKSEEFLPAATKVVQALERWRDSAEPYHSGYNVIHETSKTFFQVIEDDPVRSRQFANSMKLIGKEQGFEFSQALDTYDWESNNGGNLTVVDMGGSNGTAMKYLAEKHAGIHCVVQDQPCVIRGCQELLPEKLRGRISFQEHDFFKPQPVVGADIYFMRCILHDWPDSSCVDILRALIPALKSGSRILLNEHMLPEPGTVGEWQAREIRSVDFGVWAMGNSKEREETDWKILFAKADKRYRYERTIILPDGKMALFEFILDGKSGPANSLFQSAVCHPIRDI